ncbi:hypothetical protein GCM10010495_70840 [Kitasatospora herbaricolor]|uniref:hypothetical protein n=1 Tax=Kitasatospora herbaricolor TaxID=68217 RepID=UPI00174CE57E|nr:hypothetical protein [Kitasatospora herbaricolor]MDQ0313472.1 hypothetical protein [Kitasatospora herbaricolor]GGV43078.1 hypothetical protein GCM10010495_70840 [Kitasatospora herbaricolor]
MQMNRRAAAVGALALAGALLAAAPAQAASAPRNDGAASVCKRLPKIQERVDKAVERLNGDATVLGSVARLQQRVTDAKAADHTAVRTYLDDRLTFRKSLLPTLQTRQADLKSVAAWCAAQPSPAAGK